MTTGRLTGKRYGRLTVGDVVAIASWGEARYRCVCECGGQTVVFASNLRSGNTRSCGCLRVETAANNLRNHSK